MMVNNSTNKTNNHLSPTEKLNNDGQQFHQQNEQPPLTSNNLTQKFTTYGV
jgi:hypothetical protein